MNFNLKDYDLLDKIGSGSSSNVFAIRDKKSGQIFAAKILKSGELLEDNKNLRKKIKLIQKIQFPSVLKYCGFSPINFRGEDNPVIITEYLPNDTLRKLIQLEKAKSSPIELDSTKKLIILYGVSSGMAYLHSHGIIHHNLNPKNILLDAHLYPKINNYLFTQDPSNTSDKINLPPEVNEGHPYTEKSDVFSFASIAYELIMGENPNPNNLTESTSTISPSILNLIQRCWDQNPQNRPTFSEILEEFKTDSTYVNYINNPQEFIDYITYIDSQGEFNLTNDPIYIYPKPKFTEKENSMRICPQEIYNELSKNSKKLVERAETTNDEVAQYNVAVNFMSGIGKYPKRRDISIQFLQKSIVNGYEQSVPLFVEKFVKDAKSVKKANEFIDSYSLDDNPILYFLRGSIHFKFEEYDDAIECFLLSKNIQLAAFQLGVMYRDGIGVKKDEVQATKYFNLANKIRISKAEKNANDQINTESKNATDQISTEIKNEDNKPKQKKKKENQDNKNICPQDILSKLSKQGKSLVSKAENENDKIAQYNLGVNFFEGLGKYPKDADISIKYFHKSILNGNEDAALYYCDNVLKQDEYIENAQDFINKNKKGKNPLFDLIQGQIYMNQKMYKKAIESFEIATKNRISRASYQLGVIYRDGIGVPKNPKLSTEYFVMAKAFKNNLDKNNLDKNNLDKNNLDKNNLDTNQNPSDKQEKADILHLKGKKCLESDETKKDSLFYFKLAAKKNYIESMKELYNIYVNGIEPFERNYSKALKYAKMAADNGDVEMMKKTAFLYENGDGSELSPNLAEAFKYYKMAADKGDIESILKTASKLDLGEGTKISKKQAFNYYKIAAEKGDIDAIFNCGIKMINAEGCKGNKKEGIQLLKEASKSGHVKAKKQLKKIELDILKRKIEENDTKAMIKLSQMLIEGRYIKRNLNMAHKYLIRAKKLKDPEAKKELKKLKEIQLFESEDAREIVDYGKLFEFPKSGKKDLEKAQLWYKRAAELGSVNGMVNYARLLDIKLHDYRFSSRKNKETEMTEEEFKAMEKEALNYYKIASDKGNKIAMFHYGLCLEHGNGIKVDKQKAVEYYYKSAKKGHIIAMSNYARCLEHGYGIEKNEKEALKWYKTAMDNGSERAKGELKYLLDKMKAENSIDEEEEENDIDINNDEEEEEEENKQNEDKNEGDGEEEDVDENDKNDDEDDDFDENDKDDGEDDDFDENDKNDDEDDDVDENEEDDEDDNNNNNQNDDDDIFDDDNS